MKSRTALFTLVLGALAVLAIGADHVQQYYVDDYSTVPTIGTLFLINFASSLAVGFALLLPLRLLAGRHADALRALLALGAIAIAAGSLAGVFVAETAGLFGFKEMGYRPVIIVAIVFEAAAIVSLSSYLAVRRART